MRVLFVGGMALLAAITATPSRAAPPAAVVVDHWTGWHVGGNVGYSWGRSETDVGYFTSPGGVPIIPPPGSIVSASTDLDGWIGGGQIGGDLKHGNWVIGVEADIQWSGQGGSSSYLCAATIIGGPCLPGITSPTAATTGTALSLDQELQWFGTVRARLGVTPSPTWLAYVTGGLAYGEIKTDAILAGFTPALVAVSAFASNSTIKAGWTVGGGIAGIIDGPWRGKIEYLYMDLGTVSGTVVNTPVGIAATYSSHITDHILRIGLDYRFYH